jgi:aspartate carbamoyltransferase catalytic subunit
MVRDLISIDDLGRRDIECWLERAAALEEMPDSRKRQLLAGRLLCVLFFEPSTRTRLSFEAAMCRLGGSVSGFSDQTVTSTTKGESLRDTIKTVEQYADVIVIRHPREGAARLAAEAAAIPVINAGDGANQHPSQTLLDLYTMRKLFGRLDHLRIALVGDLKYSRTVHSLFQALTRFDGNDFVLASPELLRLPDYLRTEEILARCSVRETSDLDAALHDCDVLYMTRVQKERFPDPLDYEKVKDCYRIDLASLEGAPARLKLMHPLPRVNEIAPAVDATSHAAYFQQVKNGVTMRQAILLDLLGVNP